jgi:hypothetical protein
MLCLGTVHSWSIFRKPLERERGLGATTSLLPFTVPLAQPRPWGSCSPGPYCLGAGARVKVAFQAEAVSRRRNARLAPTFQFGHDPEKWAEFRKRYQAELKNNPALSELQAIARQRDITLVYAARDEMHNEAVILKQILELGS